MDENSGSSFDNNPFSANAFTDNSSSFGTDTTANTGLETGSDFGSGSSFDSNTGFGNDSNFGSNTAFGSDSSFGNDSRFGNNSSFGDDTNFGSNTGFGNDAGFGSDSTFGNNTDSSFATDTNFGSTSGFGSDSNFGNDAGVTNTSSFGGETGFGNDSNFNGSFGQSDVGSTDAAAASSATTATTSSFGTTSTFGDTTGSTANSSFSGVDSFTNSTSDFTTSSFSNNSFQENTTSYTSGGNDTKQGYKTNKKEKRSVTEELTISQYKQRIKELNDNAVNKHYVLFFGRPGSGKSFIIGSIVNYLKSRAPGQLIYRDEFTTIAEDKMYYSMLDYYQAGKIEEATLGSTDGKVYYELPFTFKPSDKSRDPVEFVFVDCAGEHTQRSMYQENNSKSGALPNYLTAILESDVNVKLCFVFDYNYDTKNKRTGVASQTNNLISVYNEVIHYQRPGEREFSKLMIMSKADMFRNVVNKYDGSAVKFALNEAPAFANTFYNEVFETDNSNNFTFYSVGDFIADGNTLQEQKLNYKAPEKIISWLYRDATGMSFIKKEEGFLSKLRKVLGI